MARQRLTEMLMWLRVAFEFDTYPLVYFTISVWCVKVCRVRQKHIILYQQTEAVNSTVPRETFKAVVTLVLRDYFTQSSCPLK